MERILEFNGMNAACSYTNWNVEISMCGKFSCEVVGDKLFLVIGTTEILVEDAHVEIEDNFIYVNEDITIEVWE